MKLNDSRTKGSAFLDLETDTRCGFPVVVEEASLIWKKQKPIIISGGGK